MTDKQSTVVVSRELLGRILNSASHGYVSKDDCDELRALLAATPEADPEQATDVGEPVAVVDEDDEGLFAEFIYGEDGSPLKRGDKLYLNPADKGYVTKLAHEAMQAEVARINAQPPTKSGPWEPLSAPGQIKPGDWLHFTVGGKLICTKAKEILEAGTHREEVVYNRSRNHYFITGMAVEGTSSHKGVMIAKP